MYITIEYKELFIISKPVIFMFGGHGSQYHQMGKVLYEQEAVFRQILQESDEIAYAMTGRILTAEIFDTPISTPFRAFEITHPSLIAIQYAMFRLLICKGLKPDYVWGSSAGEMVAAAASGAIEYQHVLRMALEFSQDVVATCDKGGMLAIFASPDLYDKTSELHENTELAGVSFPKHLLVSGEEYGIERAKRFLRTSGYLFQHIDIEYGFHSSAIGKAETCLNRTNIPLNQIKRPVISMISSATRQKVSCLNREFFWQTLRGTVQFFETLKNLNLPKQSIYVDCSPSGSLATFVKRGSCNSSHDLVLPVMSQISDPIPNLQHVVQLVREAVR